MKKIAIVTPGFMPVPSIYGGGVEQLITNLIDENDKQKKYKIDIYTIYDKKIENIEYKYTNIISIKQSNIEKTIEKIINKIYFLFKIEKNYNLFGKKVSKKISCEKYDKIIIENNMYTFKNICDRIQNPKTELYFHLHNDIGGIDKPIYLCKIIANKAKKVLTCSKYLKNRFEFYTKCKKVEILYNSIDFSNFFYDKDTRNIIRNNLALESNKYVYLYVGRISPEKGVEQLVKAFNAINDEDTKLLIVGDFINTSFCRLLKKNIEKNKNIICCGKINNDEVYKYMSASDCIIIPTICEEAFGLVAAEAMSCERPLIITNSGGLTEVTGELAEIVEKENIIEELKDKMIYLKNNTKLNKYLQNNVKKYVQSRAEFKIENYFENFVNIISETGE